MKIGQARDIAIVMASKAMPEKIEKVLESLGVNKKKPSSSMKQKRDSRKKAKKESARDINAGQLAHRMNSATGRQIKYISGDAQQIMQ